MIILSFNYLFNSNDTLFYHLSLLSFGYSLMIEKASPLIQVMPSLRE